MAAAGPRGRGGRAPAAAALRLAPLLGAALGSARAAVYFQEQFLDRGWKRWVSSEYKVDLGRFKLPAGKFYGDAETVNLIIISLQVYKLVETLNFMLSPHNLNHLVTKGRLVIQYTIVVGDMLRFFSSNLDQKNLSGDSHYYIMFVRKPTDWDDRMQIDDPNDIKPEDWDEPEYVMDTSAGKPEDWDDAVNGEWHYPMVKNPLYRV
ncbi:unnamed protein product [Bubo scandiacus]